MTQPFYKGRTNNHLTWVMVDATDFATPESALSAATKIKIYGKLRGAAGVNFVSSGTGSLTNDITHVGASVLGIYSIGLAKADLSDASAAWYDQYIISLSATGAAYQALVVEGKIDESAFSDVLSNAYSAAAQGASRALIVQSRLSDLDSRLASDTSDILSQVLLATSAASDAASAAAQANSRALVIQSRLSDLDSRLVSDVSDIYSAAVQANSRALVAASGASDAHSAILIVQSRLSDLDSRLTSEFSDLYSAAVALSDAVSNAYSAAVVGASRTLLVQSRLSDLDSRLASEFSDTYSALVALSDAVSNAYSAAVVGTSRTTLVQSRLSDLDSRLVSDISDLYSLVAANSDAISNVYSAAAVANSRILLNQSRISDAYSAIVAGVEIGASSMSDLRSAITAAEFDASDISDIASAVWARAGADPTAVVGVTAGMGAKLDWLTAMSRNKLLQTSSVQSLRNDGDTADIASAAVSFDAGTSTLTRAKFA